MKTKEILKEEYSLFVDEFEEFGTNKEDVIRYIKTFLGELSEDKIDILKAMKQNSRDMFFLRIRNKLQMFFEYEDIQSYSDDNFYLDKELDLILLYITYFNRLKNIINEENCTEVFKLFNFTVSNYNDNFKYLENKRDEIYYLSKGIFFQGSEGENTKDVFAEFFDEEIINLSLIKSVEKRKK